MPFSKMALPALGVTVGHYERRVTRVTAIEWTGALVDFQDAANFCLPTIVGSNDVGGLYLYAKGGVQLVMPGDFIVREHDGAGVYAMHPSVFHKVFREDFNHAELRA